MLPPRTSHVNEPAQRAPTRARGPGLRWPCARAVASEFLPSATASAPFSNRPQHPPPSPSSCPRTRTYNRRLSRRAAAKPGTPPPAHHASRNRHCAATSLQQHVQGFSSLVPLFEQTAPMCVESNGIQQSTALARCAADRTARERNRTPPRASPCMVHARARAAPRRRRRPRAPQAPGLPAPSCCDACGTNSTY